MPDHNIKKLIDDHFRLFEDKRALENQIRINNAETARVLAEEGHFDALTVNWAYVRKIFLNHPTIS